jgi:hydroxymethylpyrimidine pyrophosphatase-like HAD family hydrolase
LLGDETGETWLRDFTRRNPQVVLAFVTGRYAWSVRELVKQGRLPQPSFICCDVGTEIIDCRDPQNQIGMRYTARVAPGWDLETIYRLGEGEGVTRQEFEDGQPRFQAGFYYDGKESTLSAFRQRLQRLTDHQVLASYGEYIDVLPVTLGKGKAVQHLQEALALEWEQVVVAGDAGNDRSMFEVGFQGIVPANALDELKQIANQPWHYHSPFPAALGVRDGLIYFKLPCDA